MTMTRCQDCEEEIPYGVGSGGSVCSKCRGKRAAKVNKEKALKHGKGYFDRRNKEVGL